MSLSPSSDQPDAMQTRLHILASHVFLDAKWATDQTITIDASTGLIISVQPAEEAFDVDYVARAAKTENGTPVIDLRGKFVFHGFVDAHVHFSYTLTLRPADQVCNESDLGTEGALDSDVHLRTCLSKGLLPGPRYLCSTRAIVSTNSYGPRGEKWDEAGSNAAPIGEAGLPWCGTSGPSGAEVADGVDGVVKAVRRQVGAGADWIKFYGDYSFRARQSPVSPSTASKDTPFSRLQKSTALISTAHSLGVKVAVHASRTDVVRCAVEAGVDTVEHGLGLDEPTLKLMKEKGLLGVRLRRLRETHVKACSRFHELLHIYRTGVKLGVDIIAGGDTGVFPHGQGSRELAILARYALYDDTSFGWQKVMERATAVAWEKLKPLHWSEEWWDKARESGEWAENDVPFGSIKPGWAADIIATTIDPDKNFAKSVSASSINFVMKGGKVYKMRGKGVGSALDG